MFKCLRSRLSFFHVRWLFPFCFIFSHVIYIIDFSLRTNSFEGCKHTRPPSLDILTQHPVFPFIWEPQNRIDRWGVTVGLNYPLNMRVLIERKHRAQKMAPAGNDSYNWQEVGERGALLSAIYLTEQSSALLRNGLTLRRSAGNDLVWGWEKTLWLSDPR